MSRAAQIIAVAALLASCSSDNDLTQIVVVVNSDLSVPSQLDSIRVEMTAGGSTEVAAGRLSGPDARPLPREVNMLWGGGPLGPVDVRAIGLSGGAEVVARDARVFFIEGRSVALRLDLLRECLGVTCGAGLTCARAGCRPIDVDPSELRPYTPNPDALDAGMSCPMVPERCNGEDDDCDGNVDEEFDLNSDPLNCGGCGTSCPSAGGAPTCNAGVCEITCMPRFGDCDRDPFNGCETDLTFPTSCGSCTNVCSVPNAMPSCDMGTCGVRACDAGFGDCDMDPANGCEAPTTTITDCGTCGMTCALADATPTCMTGSCAVESCNAGFGDCDTDATNGCENTLDSLTDCGACGMVCDLANGTETCGSDVCTIDTCDPGFDDCNSMDPDGCETSLSTLTDCGSCGTACAPPNATGTCATRSCAVATCNVGFDDCNTSPGDGCEADLTSDDANCGMCGNTCGGSTACFDSACRNLTDVIATATGTAFSCALRVSGAVECWGANGDGQLGDGSTTQSTTPVFTGISDAVAIAAGGIHACAVRSGGTVQCWGRNRDGQLGDGSTSRRTSPVDASGIADAVAVGAGLSHTCAVRAGGQVMCWGRNRRGQLGDGSTSRRTTPVMATGLADAVAVDAGDDHSCALRTTGAVSCWGENGQGQLGDGTTTDRRTPTATMGLADATRVAVGAVHSCATRATGAVSCWGDNGGGRLGTAGGDRSMPTAVAGVTGATHVSAGGSHTCARLGSGAVFCWGSDGSGQLGNGGAGGGATPSAVTGLSDAAEVSAGGSHTCAARATGGVDCWGANGSGQLGRAGGGSQAPVSVTGLP